MLIARVLIFWHYVVLNVFVTFDSRTIRFFHAVLFPITRWLLCTGMSTGYLLAGRCASSAGLSGSTFACVTWLRERPSGNIRQVVAVDDVVLRSLTPSCTLVRREVTRLLTTGSGRQVQPTLLTSFSVSAQALRYLLRSNAD